MKKESPERTQLPGVFQTVGHGSVHSPLVPEGCSQCVEAVAELPGHPLGHHLDSLNSAADNPADEECLPLRETARRFDFRTDCVHGTEDLDAFSQIRGGVFQRGLEGGTVVSRQPAEALALLVWSQVHGLSPGGLSLCSSVLRATFLALLDIIGMYNREFGYEMGGIYHIDHLRCGKVL